MPSTTPSPARLFEDALALYRSGRHQDALALVERQLDSLPPVPELFNLAAVAAGAGGDRAKAERHWRALIALRPDYLNAHTSLGLLLMESGRNDEAEAAFRAVLALEPGHADTYVNLGNLYRAAGRIGDAEDAYRQASNIQPGHVDAQYNLGLLLADTDRPVEAEQAFRRSLAIKPDQSDVWNDLGNLCMRGLRPAEAEAAYRRAIDLTPGYAEAHFNLARLLYDVRRLADAYDALQRVLAIDPRHAGAINCLANLLSEAGRHDEAERAFRQALAIKPEAATIHNNLGTLLMERGRFEEAEAAFREALRIEPDYGNALGQAVTCARRRYHWDRAGQDGKAVVAFLRQGRAVPELSVMNLGEADRGELHREAARLGTLSRIARQLAAPRLRDPTGEVHGGRLRIGYLSADFREHAVMHLLGGVLDAHDRDRFEIHAYSTGPDGRDAGRLRVERACEHFHDLRGLSDMAAAERIAADGIDILVDLTGHTHGARPAITAARPAPVQVNWLGYPGSLGHARLADYIIGDPVVTPAEAAPHFSETIAQLPHCYLPNDRERLIGPCPTRVEEGLPEDGFVFCNFNQAVKLNPETFDVWCGLLKEVPGSVLWLARAGSVAIANLRREAEQRGVAGDRLVFAQRTDAVADHLGRLRLADLALDTYPYTSHSTGCDLLWAGVPLVTRMGETFASRVAASLLRSVGLPELIVEDWRAYHVLAKRLATDPESLRSARDRLAASRSTCPLFDTAGFARDLESLYGRMWEHHLGGGRGPLLAAS